VSTVAEPTRRTVRHVWLPLTVIVLLGGAFAAVWAFPYDEFSRFQRVVVSFGIVSLTLLLLLIWWLCLSGVSWWLRLGVPLLAAALAVAAVRKVDFSGDMVPLVRFRWSPTPDELLEAYAQARPAAPASGADDAEVPDDDPSGYPEYRNRARDGVARGPALARDWQARPPRLLWKHPCGGGYAGFAVAGDFAVTVEQRREDEAVVCYDAATGRERWSHHYPAHFYDVRAEGPMATPTLVGGDVYSLGGTGRLVCLDLATGELKWEVDALADNDNLPWGMSGSPLVYDDVVVVSPGEQRGAAAGRAVVAYDRKTGRKVWGAGGTKGGYSSPMLATLCGVRQVLVLDGKRLAGYDPAGAGELWSVPWEAQNDINVAQPVMLGDDRLFVTSGYANRCGAVRLTRPDGKWQVGEEWHNASLRCRFCSPVTYEGLLYGLDEGTLECVDPANGKRLWRGGRYFQGQLLRSDDLLVILSEKGELALVEAAGAKSRELGRVKVLAGDKTWNCPCLAGGKAYVRNHQEMACYDLRE
jgi:outer membrane protein assembly factor BamB